MMMIQSSSSSSSFLLQVAAARLQRDVDCVHRIDRERMIKPEFRDRPDNDDCNNSDSRGFNFRFPSFQQINWDKIEEVNTDGETDQAMESIQMPEKKTLLEEENTGIDQALFHESPRSCSSDNNSSDGFLSNRHFGEKSALECKNDKFVSSGFWSEKDFDDDKTVQKDSSVLDSDSANKLETLWEHQELIEQLKMELRKVRATGLPTILEESESPKIMEESLKPWKIEEDLQYEDCMDEVKKNYKSYIETMRKFDILNYQKMYAMGFLQLKDPFQPTMQQKPSPPTTIIKSLISQNLWLFKNKSCVSDDPVKKLVSDLRGDLEAVYMGQMCLSWEFLRWQYAKVLELWSSDPHGTRRYNEVAAEFQQFQVLVERFVEDEPFQGPRVQSYIKTRCVVRNLLQVPAIREDDVKDKKWMRKGKGEDGEYIITSEMLVGMVEESIRVLWRFIRSDKEGNTIPINNGHKKMPHLHNSRDLKLLLLLNKTLQKKERKVRDIVRSEKCILRRFRHTRKGNNEDDSDLFFAQVEMKLVGRVLNMSKLTRDHLIWCRNKLCRINFLSRKLYVHPPSFVLFPC